MIRTTSIADHIDASTGLAAESGFTAAFVLGAVALVIAMLAASPIPGRRTPALVGATSEPRVAAR
jgi:hypothetical protein